MHVGSCFFLFSLSELISSSLTKGSLQTTSSCFCEALQPLGLPAAMFCFCILSRAYWLDPLIVYYKGLKKNIAEMYLQKALSGSAFPFWKHLKCPPAFLVNWPGPHPSQSITVIGKPNHAIKVVSLVYGVYKCRIQHVKAPE